IVVGSGVSAWQYILKPEKIEVYGGDDPGDLKLISSIKIPLPAKSPPTEQVGISVPLESQQYRYYKILAHPVAKLPEWHRGKGEKGWVFVDEVFFY
ncbi:MAG: peptidylprolyl isomerase, partial [Cyclobacteriaceae bacterium]|nr:peptidylprolyl isomerase [Cyclobacteriaceae bacterium]